MQNVIHTVPMDATRKDPANANHVVRARTRMTRAPTRVSVCNSLHWRPTLIANDKMNGWGRLKAQVATRVVQLRGRERDEKEHSLLVFGSDLVLYSNQK